MVEKMTFSENAYPIKLSFSCKLDRKLIYSFKCIALIKFLLHSSVFAAIVTYSNDSHAFII